MHSNGPKLSRCHKTSMSCIRCQSFRFQEDLQGPANSGGDPLEINTDLATRVPTQTWLTWRVSICWILPDCICKCTALDRKRENNGKQGSLNDIGCILDALWLHYDAFNAYMSQVWTFVPDRLSTFSSDRAASKAIRAVLTLLHLKAPLHAVFCFFATFFHQHIWIKSI